MNSMDKILVVDDSVMTRNMVTRLLSELKYTNISTANSADEASRIIIDSYNAGSPFNLIFCDIKMPGMTGLEFLNFIRKASPIPEIGFVVVSAESENATVLEALTSGADGFVAKPISAKLMSETIEKATLKRQTRLKIKNASCR